ncbi:hypothetical protein ScPMuIL_008136 [Solemya velum]
MANVDIAHFDMGKVLELFTLCCSEDDSLNLDAYIDAYGEVCKLFKILGSVFSFVLSDVVEKVGILKDYRKSETAENYVTIQSMIEYEVENNLTNQKHNASGSRTLLRLHRALEFLLDFKQKIKEADTDSKLGHICRESYDRTIGKFHPWLIRKAVHVAVYTLPKRHVFLEKINIHNEEDVEDVFVKVVEIERKIYDITQNLYAQHSLLDLP